MGKKSRSKNRGPAAARPAVVQAAEKPKLPAALWAVLALALAVKLLYLQFSQTSPFYEPLLLDPKYYHEWASRLVQGQWDRGVFYGLPLYPYFLALLYKLSGSSLLFVKLVQIALGLATLFLVYKTGEKLGGRAAGLLAAFIGALYGPLFFHEGVLIPEALGVPLYALAFYLALSFLDDLSVKKAALLGAAAALATLTKAGLLLFMAVFLITCAARHRDKVRRIALCALVYAATLLPVPLHNAFWGRDAVLLTSHAGFNFYIGNNPQSEGVFVAPEGIGTNVDSQVRDSRAVAEREMGRELKPSEVSKYWSERAWAFIRENPAKFLELCGRKLVIFFDAREISDVDDYQFAARLNDLLKFPWPNFALLAPLAFMGFVALWRTARGRWALLWLGLYLAGLAGFFVNARYRLPMLPVLFVAAGLGLLELKAAVGAMQFRRLLILAAALAAGIGISQARLVGTDWSRDYVNAGDALLEGRNDTAGAMEFYRQALQVKPDSSKANLAMGIALSREGREDEARDFYLRSIELDPSNSQPHNNLGLWHEKQGDVETAERYFLKAIELKPDSAQAHNNLGMLYGKRGEDEKAVRAFELSLKFNPDSARANTNLGLMRYRAGRRDEARALWERALEIDPRFEQARRGLELLERS